ncbi:hypothetical protein G3O00_02705 [Burkholderia sp. Ac-20384]|uniref:Uncharacterized protein n=1 Tax=Burkholderia lata (strain ATCC 17760 / DSM 23089 / LMG 22485 / NCIMB 9086 / R18194 / 383) TaxID=482957 RepID=A0A6P3BFE9_BURL3|nr:MULTISPECIES: hypothetical protein [Burkholderia]MBN3822528.1 hypothetical protein [Burkholderia sp. Ac-20384]VWD55498.1 hypothetical protein BLA39750_06657 [Burkholderia lata]
MNPIRKLMLCGAIPFLLVAGAAQADGGGIGRSGTYMSHTSDWTMMMMDKLTPEQRTQAIVIQQKMMAMDMAHNEAMAKMQMQHDKEMMALQSQLLELYKGH